MHYGYDNFFYVDEKKKISSTDLNAPICIQGLPGIALAGKSAVDYIIKKLDAKPICDFYFYDLPPQVFVENGEMMLPRISLFLWTDREKKHDLILLTGDAQPVSHMGANILSDILASYLAKLNIRLIITLGASAVQAPVKNPKIYVSSTSPELTKSFTNMSGVYPFEGGVITGMNGLTPGFCKNIAGVEGCILLVEACRFLESDLNASKFLVKLLANYLNLKIDLSELEEASRKLEAKIEELRRKEEEMKRRRESGSPTYIG